jgi:hypothetical protein
MKIDVNTILDEVSLSKIASIKIISDNKKELTIGDFMEYIPDNIEGYEDITIKYINISKIGKVLFTKRSNFHRKMVLRYLLDKLPQQKLYIKKVGNGGSSYFHPLLLPLLLSDYEHLNTMIILNILFTQTIINNNIDLYDMREINNDK